ncbi:MAG: branched-chain amino acid ABC transporter permease [Thermoprotei archaeon]|nr:MAG: branched-chain amino acid ABC transporter permease [Thermoprotei archaeon]
MFEIPPLVLNILINFAVGLIVTLSLNIEVGYAGIPQSGRVLAVLVGAIVAGAIPGRVLAALMGQPYGAEYAYHLINFKLVAQINNVLAANPLLSIAILAFTLIVAAGLGAFVGYITAYPAIRLREAYLGITLLAFGDALQVIAWNYEPLVGATQGVLVPDPFRWIGAGTVRFVSATFIILGIAILVFLYVERLGKSPFGRVLKAMRDSELAAKVYGKDIPRLRAQALITGSALAAIGGALWAFYVGSMKAITYNRLVWTFWPWAYMMLGGTGNNVGVLVGVLVFSTVRTLIYSYKGVLSAIIPISPTWLEYILVGLVIVLIALFRPQGIIPEKPALTLPKGRIEAIRRVLEEEVKSK